MFRDPRVLGPQERSKLITQLRTAVEGAPHIPEVRVLLGMGAISEPAGAGGS
jgi:hypothetical protein